jgi:inorganic phosphate transporter, PiT family
MAAPRLYTCDGAVFWSHFRGELVALILAVALALGFECVNGFHDTANAVATVIYTHSLPPRAAVIWSGL